MNDCPPCVGAEIDTSKGIWTRRESFREDMEGNMGMRGTGKHRWYMAPKGELAH